MAQTAKGAILAAAKKAGISPYEYRERRARGEKRCTKCKNWKPESLFCGDRSRFDGFSAKCKDCSYTAHPRVYGESPMKGKRFPPEDRANMGRSAGFVSEKRGRKRSTEERATISAAVRKVALRGPECPSYRDGKSVERFGERMSDRYKQWRYDVYLRDRFTCQRCGDARGGNLHAHHIKAFADFPALRFDISNGETLCKECHKVAHRKHK